MNTIIVRKGTDFRVITTFTLSLFYHFSFIILIAVIHYLHTNNIDKPIDIQYLFTVMIVIITDKIGINTYTVSVCQ